MRKRCLIVFMCLALLFSSSGFFIMPKVKADIENIAEAGARTPPAGSENPQPEEPAANLTNTDKPLEQPTAAPLVVAAEASGDGAVITLSFDRVMKEPGGNESNFCVMADGIRDQVAMASLNMDNSKIDLNLQVPLTGGQTVVVSYTAGSLASVEGGLLDSFSDMKVEVSGEAKEPAGKESDSLNNSILPVEPQTVAENRALLAPVLLRSPSNIHSLGTWGDPMLGSGMPGVNSGDTIVLPGDGAANTSLVIPAGITALIIQGSNTYYGLNIELAAGHPGLTLTIQNLNLAAHDNKAGIDFGNAAGACTLIIVESNVIQAGSSCAGVQVPAGCSLTIDGGGSLTASGGSGLGGAGIGGAGGYNGGSITILGGTIEARGGQGGAGIGGGSGPARGADVIISGGNITATGGDDGSGDDGGAGIGGGKGTGDYGTITINGSTIIATGGSRAAGIGAGDGNGSGGSIVINAGNVTTTGKDGGAGIGDGYGCGNTTITINGGNIQATGSANAAGIGGGDKSGAVQITIYDGTINAVGGSGTTIDGDDNGNDITVQSGGAGIGGACKGGTGGLTIYGGTIQAQGGYNSAGIGSGYKAGSMALIISGGSIKASGGENGAGIGSGKKGGGADTVVSGGRIEAIGGPNAQDIGGGVDGSAGSLTVNGWAVIIADDVIAATGSSGPYTIRILNTTGTSAGVQTVTLKTGAGGDCISGATGSDGLFGSFYLKNNTDYQVAVAGYKIHKSGETDFQDATTFNSGTSAGTLDFVINNAPTVNGWSIMTAPESGTYRRIYGEGNRVWTIGGNKVFYSENYPLVPLSEQYSRDGLPPYDMSFFQSGNVTRGWVVGYGTTGAHTTDLSGTAWENMQMLGGGTLCAVDFPSANVGYASGTAKVLIKTTDGGQNWSVVQVDPQHPLSYSTVSALCFVDENTGYACISDSELRKTTDGGKTWYSTDVTDPYCTTDVFFLDANHGWAVGINKIFRYENGAWYEKDSPYADQHGLESVFFLNQNEGWISGQGGVILHSTDGGASWTPQESGTDKSLLDIYFVASNLGYAVGSDGTILRFTGAAAPTISAPTVATGAVSNIITRGATVAGNVTSDGGSAVTERGIVYSGLANPTLDSGRKAVVATAGTGQFSVNITNLMSGTIAHARAYATNSKGTSYGEDVSFTTATANGLTVTTGDITDISSKGARVTGYAIPGNLAGIIERGVVYSTNANPTFNDFKVPYTADALEGPILVNLTYLNPNTTYHVRAYAIDSQNIAVYGEDKVFTSAAGTYGWTDLSVNLPANARLDPDLPDNAQGATTMMAMDFVDANNGWLALTRYANNQPVNELLITHDGGATFQVVPAPAEFYSISFKSASEGLAAGNDGRIYRTLDGGLTWRNAGSGVRPYYAVTYPKESDSGYACGYWMRLSRVRPVDPVTGNETGLESMPRETGIEGWSENLNCISFVPSGNSWEGWAGGVEAIIHWTGTEWRADGTYPSSDVLVNGSGGSHNGICMVDNKEGWCVMDGGFILHTANGLEWTIQASPDVYKIGINDYGLHRTLMDVDFLNNQEGWAVGSKGVVLHTVDGGMSWNMEAPGMTNRMMTSVKAISPTCGYALGNDGTFLKYGTSGEAVINAPTVTTGTVSGVSDTSASVAGNVAYDGGSTVTERGVVYSTSADPTIENGTKVTAAAAGIGEFSVNLTGLTPGSTYHVRAFATNNVGTRYGEDKTFTSETSTVGVSRITLNKNETALSAGLQELLIATVLPENAGDKRVLWTIASESEAGVLTVVDGLISAQKQGTARVRATSAVNPEAYAECIVTVNPPTLLRISLTPETVSLTTGQSKEMKVTAFYSDQSSVDVTSGSNYSFSGSSIASISSAGLLTANSPGMVVLTATYQEKQDTVNITVASSGGGGGSASNSTEPINTPKAEQVQTPLESEVKRPADEPSDLTGHWAHDCIMALIANGIIKGYLDLTIRPEQEITRAEAASLLVQSLGLQDYQLQNSQSPYTDQLPAWAERAILICTEKGLMKGYPDGSFKPDQHITRAEMCAALIQAYPQVMQPRFTLAFTDRDSIPEWALAYIELAAANKLVGGYPDGTFKPDAFIKRAEVFTIICHLKGYHQQHSS
ncbi:MAG: S-layer homology domain-containing protein [Syntrophomonadaceae bacterium]